MENVILRKGRGFGQIRQEGSENLVEKDGGAPLDNT